MQLTKEYFDEQLEKLATKRDLSNFTTKDDLDALKSELANKEDINKVLTAVDGIAKQMNDYNQNLPAINQQPAI